MTFGLMALASVLGLSFVWWAMHRSLRQRPMARSYRDKFSSIAADLIGKPEIPDVLARHLLMGASIPAGWLTRFMVCNLACRVFSGPKKRTPESIEFAEAIAALPNNLKARYVVAVLSLSISDSYRSAFLGAVWRGVNSWTIDAVKSIRVDLDAHATEQVVVQFARARPPIWSRARGIECFA